MWLVDSRLTRRIMLNYQPIITFDDSPNLQGIFSFSFFLTLHYTPKWAVFIIIIIIIIMIIRKCTIRGAWKWGFGEWMYKWLKWQNYRNWIPPLWVQFSTYKGLHVFPLLTPGKHTKLVTRKTSSLIFQQHTGTFVASI